MKGILMKPWKVKATADGIATVTRRLAGLKEINQEPDKWKYRPTANIPRGFFFMSDDGLKRTVHPRYQVDELVYMKEVWAVDRIYDHLKPRDIPIDVRRYFPGDPLLRYGHAGKWRSPLFLPAEFARHFIRIKDVRAERLENPLSVEELMLEGGAEAIPLLMKIDGLWLWRYEYNLVNQEEVVL